MNQYFGRFCRFLASSDDFSTPAAVTIRDEDGDTITLAAGERLIIDTLVVSNGGTARLVTLFDDADAGGDADAEEILWSAAMAANSSHVMNYLAQPLICGKARSLSVIAAGASTGSRVSGTGRIIR